MTPPPSQGRRKTPFPGLATTRKTDAPANRRAKTTMTPVQTGMQLHTPDGARKYLTAGERDAFLRASEQADRSAVEMRPLE